MEELQKDVEFLLKYAGIQKCPICRNNTDKLMWSLVDPQKKLCCVCRSVEAGDFQKKHPNCSICSMNANSENNWFGIMNQRRICRKCHEKRYVPGGW